MLLDGTRDPLYDGATHRWIVTSRGLLDSLAFVARIYNRTHRLGPPITADGRRLGPKELAANLFAQGKLGIDLDGSWLSSRWYPGNAVPWRQWQRVMGYARMPTEGGAPPAYVTLSGGWAYAISARSAHKNDSFALVKAFCTRDTLAALDQAIGSLAPRRDAGDNAAYNAAPLTAAFAALWQGATYRPVDPAYPAVSRLLGQAMDDVIVGETPAHAMTRFAAGVIGLVGRDRVERR
jgi:multiple sugar transport system substrate-binding protein